METDKLRTILDAASKVFLQHGFAAATTDTIQREAGVSKATLYTHYAGKEALFAAVIERECAKLADAIAAVEAAPGDLGRTLTAMGRAYLQIALSPSGLALFRVVASGALRFPALARQFYLQGPKLMADAVLARLVEASRDGEIDTASVGLDSAANLFVSLVRAEGEFECVTRPDSRPSEVQMDTWGAGRGANLAQGIRRLRSLRG